MFLIAIIFVYRMVPPETLVRLVPSHRAIAVFMMAVMLVSSISVSGTAQESATGLDRFEASEPTKEQPATSSLAATPREELLREGTLIPPTVGKIVPVGRRWGFVPDDPAELAPGHLRSAIGAYRRSSSSLISKPFPTRLGDGLVTTASDGRSDPTLAGSAPEQPITASTPESGAERVKTIILAENLMLQRIVEAVIADPADDQWTISGEITEFRNQNRLRIQTAQRTNQQ
jgi:hypothetical protein